MASRDIGKLKEPFQTSIRELVKRARAKGIPILITDTTRTLAEQKELVRKGFSKTLKSKHLTGEAVDIAFQIDGRLSYDEKLYKKLYEITKTLPFVIWPYKDLGWKWDRPHHQYDKTKKIVDNESMSCEKEKKEIQALNTEIGDTITERDDEIKGRERIQDALGIPDDDIDSILEGIGKLTVELQAVTTQRDNCQRGFIQQLTFMGKLKLLIGRYDS